MYYVISTVAINHTRRRQTASLIELRADKPTAGDGGDCLLSVRSSIHVGANISAAANSNISPVGSTGNVDVSSLLR